MSYGLKELGEKCWYFVELLRWSGDVWVSGDIYVEQIKEKISTKQNIVIYRDDGVGIFQNALKAEVERKKKQIVKVFKDRCLSITIKFKLKSVNLF